MRRTRLYKDLPYNASLAGAARRLRKAGLLHEALLWNQLKNGRLQGLDFDRQKIIGSHIVDFFCAQKGLVIEVDGPSHTGREREDALRDEFLSGLGLKVLRVSARSVLKDVGEVVAAILSFPDADVEGDED